MTELVHVVPSAGGLATIEVDLLAAVLSGRKANTLRAYQGDLSDFARFLGLPTPGAALNAITAFSPGIANATAIAYRAHLMQRGLSSATIGRRLAALRAACKVARLVGQITWELEVESPKAETYRDTSGPGRAGWTSLLSETKHQATSAIGRRNLALVRLLHDLALRRGEAVGLDLADVDLTRSIITVRGKGKTGKVPITLPPPTASAIADWIVSRGDRPGPLFIRLDHPELLGRLTGTSVWEIVSALGRGAKLSAPLRPHGLRHQGITRALDATKGDVRAVRKFSRHAKLETLIVYDDNRSDLAGDVARLVSDD